MATKKSYGFRVKINRQCKIMYGKALVATMLVGKNLAKHGIKEPAVFVDCDGTIGGTFVSVCDVYDLPTRPTGNLPKTLDVAADAEPAKPKRKARKPTKRPAKKTKKRGTKKSRK